MSKFWTLHYHFVERPLSILTAIGRMLGIVKGTPDVAVAGKDSLAARFCRALGVERCRSLCVRMDIDSLVTVEATSLVTHEAMQGLVDVLEKCEYTIVEKARLRELEIDALKWRECHGRVSHVGLDMESRCPGGSVEHQRKPANASRTTLMVILAICFVAGCILAACAEFIR